MQQALVETLAKTDPVLGATAAMTDAAKIAPASTQAVRNASTPARLVENPRGLEAAARVDEPVRTARAAGSGAEGTAVHPGQTGTYGELKAQKKVYGETEALDMDHQPSFAAQVAAREAALGRRLTPAERVAVKANTPAVASPRAVHQQTSPTYGGRNTPARIAEDAADLDTAAARDRAAFDEAMRNR